jgi:hypothetical protein
MGKKSNKRTHPATLSPRSTGFHGGIKNSLFLLNFLVPDFNGISLNVYATCFDNAQTICSRIP